MCPNDYEQVCIMIAMQIVLVNVFVYFSLLYVYLFVVLCTLTPSVSGLSFN